MALLELWYGLDILEIKLCWNMDILSINYWLPHIPKTTCLSKHPVINIKYLFRIWWKYLIVKVNILFPFVQSEIKVNSINALIFRHFINTLTFKWWSYNLNMILLALKIYCKCLVWVKKDHWVDVQNNKRIILINGEVAKWLISFGLEISMTTVFGPLLA